MAVSNGLGDKASFFPTMIGKKIPEFSLETIAGEGGLSSAELKRNTIVNFWASWCTSCRAEHAQLFELGKKYPLYGINSADGQAAALSYLNENHNPFRKVAFDPQRKVAIAFGTQGLPETFVVAKDGTIYYHLRGPLTQEVIDTQIVPIMTELEQRK